MAMIKIFLPFILTAVLAILTIYLAKKWSVREEASGWANQNRLSAGMLIGMSLGLALGSVFRFNVGLTTVIGMLIGMTIAHYIGK
ncbi:hypothetical protein [Streptococcus sobrinus]|uniref:hypothetical protein n=1 Tax=Streptococcus sobrinus TaxID=1310 RepID=UPI00031298F5|nr:hypothetical protein [Streptococcus sobrinus]